MYLGAYSAKWPFFSRKSRLLESAGGHAYSGSALIRGYGQARAGGFLIAAVAGLQCSSRQIVEVVVARSGNLNGHGTGAIGWNCAAGKSHG